MHLATGLLVQIELVETVSSKYAKPGDVVRLRLASPIMVDGDVVVPAGIEGAGEVIDAAAGGGAGKPGKLVLAARYLDYGALRIPLRAFKMSGAGGNETAGVIIASAVIGPAVMFANGHEAVFPAGSTASAKIAADIDLPISAGASANPDNQPGANP